jgi:hypothetical protein
LATPFSVRLRSPSEAPIIKGIEYAFDLA